METIELAQRQSKLNKKLNAQEFNDLKHRNSLPKYFIATKSGRQFCLLYSLFPSQTGYSLAGRHVPISLLLLLYQAVYSWLDASFIRNKMNKIGLRLSKVGIRVWYAWYPIPHWWWEWQGRYIRNTKLHLITNSRERKEPTLDDSCLIVKFCAVPPEENIKYKYRNKVCQTGYSPSSGFW